MRDEEKRNGREEGGKEEKRGCQMLLIRPPSGIYPSARHPISCLYILYLLPGSPQRRSQLVLPPRASSLAIVAVNCALLSVQVIRHRQVPYGVQADKQVRRACIGNRVAGLAALPPLTGRGEALLQATMQLTVTSSHSSSECKMQFTGSQWV